MPAAETPKITKRKGRGGTTEIVDRFFGAVAARDLDAMAACWQPGGIDRLAGHREMDVPAGMREYFGQIFAAFPDFELIVLQRIPAGDRCTVHWRATGTFAGAPFEGIEPTGARVQVEGLDLLTVEDDLISRNEAFFDGAEMARQLGVLPAAGSSQEQRLNALVNRGTRAKRRIASDLEPVADGVWLIRGGFPLKTMNVYLIEDEGQITVFDAGIHTMTNAIAAAGARAGGIKRVVLGHGHADHRGAAGGLGAPIYCHPAEKADAEGDGGMHYFHPEMLNPIGKRVMPALLSHWDGGPVEIAGTVAEGDDIAGFRVVHIPGHAPGMIALWRESDRLALTSDCFYTLDPQTGRKGAARLPHAAFNQDTEQARQSIRKLAALEPAAAWPGHADPLRGDVRSALETAAATT